MNFCENCIDYDPVREMCMPTGEYSGKSTVFCADRRFFISNADKIRDMDDEELVSILRCPASMDEYYEMNECLSITCSECKLKWLKEKAEET